MLVGGTELAQVATAQVEEACEQYDDGSQEGGDDGEAYQPVARGLALGVVDEQLVADALHAVGEHHVVDGVGGLEELALGIEGILPAACPLVDFGDGVVAVFVEFLPGQGHSLVGLALRGEEVDLEDASVYRGLTLLYACLIALVSLEEGGHVAVVEVGDGATRVDVEDALRGVLLCYLLGPLQQLEGLLRVVAHLNVDDVHVDGRHALVVAFLLHEFNDFVEVLLGLVAVAADAVDVAQHVVGHVHLLVELALTQLL